MKTIRTYVNVAEAGFASSLLEAAGIQALLKDEASFLLTPGPATGGIQLQVDEADEERALRVLLEGLDAADDGETSDGAAGQENAGPPEHPSKGRFPLGMILTGAAFLAVLAFAVDQWNINQHASARGSDYYEQDFDDDGKADHFSWYRDGYIVRTETDRNGDGRADEWMKYDREGRPEHGERDLDFDGRPDVWYFYRKGEIESVRSDTDFDGRPDWFTTYEKGNTVREDCRPRESEIVVRRRLFVNEILREELVDENQDGKFDYKIFYDAFGAPSARMPIDGEK